MYHLSETFRILSIPCCQPIEITKSSIISPQIVNLKQNEVLPLDPALQIAFNRPTVESDAELVALAVQVALESVIKGMFTQIYSLPTD